MKKYLYLVLVMMVFSIHAGQSSIQDVRTAADQGDAEAQHNLGVMYDKGQGVKQDDHLALSWYRKAADQGVTDARQPSPNKDRLKSRFLELNKAIAENDIDTLYAITAPAITGDRIPFEQFKDIYVPRFRSRGSEAELARDCGCQTLARTRTDQLFIRCVFVITIPFDKRRASILEMWEYINGEWYWGFTDYHETQGRCPSGS